MPQTVFTNILAHDPLKVSSFLMRTLVISSLKSVNLIKSEILSGAVFEVIYENKCEKY